MEKQIGVNQFIKIIEQLPADAPYDSPRVWYKTQKEHWLGWLNNYHTPGAYGRTPDPSRDARYVYNHIVCPDMLLWLAKALEIDPELQKEARIAYESGSSLMAKSGGIRKHIPWSVIYAAICTRENNSLLHRIGLGRIFRQGQ